MRLVVLGSGTSVPHPLRTASAYWLETSSGSLLLDIGPDAIHRMAQERLDWAGLDSIWISHFHLDHMGGLAPFLFSARWAPQTRERRKPLTIFGGPGLKALFQATDEAGNYRLLDQGFPVEIREIAAGTRFEILPGVQARTFSTPHTSESMAIRLEDSGAAIVYTSDTGYTEALADFSMGAELLVIECSFFREKPSEKHLNLSDAMQIAALAQPSQVLLTHLYPEWDGVDVEAEARKLWTGKTIEARDGSSLIVQE
jgi:ribonuclease BN (tRNA processing enzyme)